MIVFAIGAVIVGAILLMKGLNPHQPPMVTAGGLWLAYAVYELMVAQGPLGCDGGCNIRVDLVVLLPILLGVTAYALRANLRARQAAHRDGLTKP